MAEQTYAELIAEIKSSGRNWQRDKDVVRLLHALEAADKQIKEVRAIDTGTQVVHTE